MPVVCRAIESRTMAVVVRRLPRPPPARGKPGRRCPQTRRDKVASIRLRPFLRGPPVLDPHTGLCYCYCYCCWAIIRQECVVVLLFLPSPFGICPWLHFPRNPSKPFLPARRRWKRRRLQHGTLAERNPLVLFRFLWLVRLFRPDMPHKAKTIVPVMTRPAQPRPRSL